MSKGAAGGSYVERMSLEQKDFICVSWVDAPFLPVKYERSVHLVVAAGCVLFSMRHPASAKRQDSQPLPLHPSSVFSLWSLRRHFFAGSSRTLSLSTACHLDSWSRRSRSAEVYFRANYLCCWFNQDDKSRCLGEDQTKQNESPLHWCCVFGLSGRLTKSRKEGPFSFRFKLLIVLWDGALWRWMTFLIDLFLRCHSQKKSFGFSSRRQRCHMFFPFLPLRSA